MKRISILVPCYNEEQVLPLFISSLQQLLANNAYAWEVLLVDDGSTDGTLAIMHSAHQKDARIHYLELSRNFGKENALLAGIDYISGDAVVIMDADLQHPVSVIPEMIKEWEAGYDDVYARRKTRGKESIMRRVLTKIYYRLLQSYSDTNVYPNVGDFRLLDRTCINALRSIRETDRYTKGMYAYIGFRKKNVDFYQEDRAAGKSKWNFFQLMRLAVNGLLSSTIKPLQMATKVGMFISFAAFAYMIFVFIRSLIWGDPVKGFPTLIIVILLLGGIQLFSIGIMGEYIGRIFHEAKHRPTYFVRTYNGEKKI